MLRRIRRVLAALMFIGITLLFLDFTGSLQAYIGWMAKVQFLPAIMALNIAVIIGLLAVTLIFGRVYCSVICPLGIMQDLIAWIGGRRWKGKRWHEMKPGRYSHSEEKRWLRISVLVIMVISIIFGLSLITSLLAPYSSYGRIASTLLQPVYIFLNNWLAGISESMGNYWFYEKDLWLRSVPTLIVASLTLLIIAVLAWKGGRTYCNTICPVGTVLGYVSKWSWLRINLDKNKCIGCKRCEKSCKTSCIDIDKGTVDHSRCVTCGVCIGKCKSYALSYSHLRHKPKDRDTDMGRRSFLIGTALVSSSVLLAQEKKKVDGGLAKIEDKVMPKRTTKVTPPGSLSADNLSKHCTACQLCVSECPNGVLRPSSSLSDFMQPYSSFERGYCRPECTRCSEVCPTGAIIRITREEKSSIQTGHAVWIEANCIPITDGVSCGNCARHCPTGAIQMIDYKGVRVPAVNDSLCIGCGACENLCPSRPLSAIYVEGHEHHSLI